MVSLYRLMHLDEELDEKYEEMKEHALVEHNSGNGKGKFQGKFYHCGKKGHRAIV